MLKLNIPNIRKPENRPIPTDLLNRAPQDAPVENPSDVFNRTGGIPAADVTPGPWRPPTWAPPSDPAPAEPQIQTLGQTPGGDQGGIRFSGAPQTVGEYQSPQVEPTAPETQSAPNSTMQPSIQDLLRQKEQQLAERTAAPAQKQSPAKQALFMALQAIGNIATGQGNKPIEWLGNAKKNMEIGRLQGEVGPLREQVAFQQQTDLRNAQTADIQRRPEKERAALQAKFDLEARRQQGRIDLQRQKDESEGKKWKQTSRNGLFFKQYADGREEPLVNPTTGEQERDLLEMPIETTSENGTRGFTTFGKIMTADATKAYRDATLALDRDRFAETQKQNQINNQFRAQQMQTARSNFVELLNLRKQALQLQAQAQTSRDTNQAATAAKQAQDAETKIAALKALWLQRVGTGGFTQEEYNQLVQELP